MDELESKNGKPKEGRRFDPELLKKGLRCDLDQYDMLLRCSKKKDMTEWNDWRKTNKDEDICLEGANLQDFYLNGVWLHEDHANLYGKVYLEGAIFRFAKLQDAKFWRAHLRNADFYAAEAEESNFCLSRLEGTDFTFANLKEAVFSFSTVDGYTIFSGCKVDQGTYFLGVGLNNVRIDPGIKQHLERNIRYWRWQQWYKWKDGEYRPGNKRRVIFKILISPIRAFWWMSDYGLSTGRIILTFFALALIFANIYYHWGRIAPPGIVENLFVDRNGVPVEWWLVPLRTLYFSIVTMTTLGFGDMYANSHSVFGHILLSIQVILGYVLLGALVTRFAVLFTAGGPAGKFSNDK